MGETTCVLLRDMFSGGSWLTEYEWSGTAWRLHVRNGDLVVKMMLSESGAERIWPHISALAKRIHEEFRMREAA